MGRRKNKTPDPIIHEIELQRDIWESASPCALEGRGEIGILNVLKEMLTLSDAKRTEYAQQQLKLSQHRYRRTQH